MYILYTIKDLRNQLREVAAINVFISRKLRMQQSLQYRPFCLYLHASRLNELLM
jgi:hypothetical protein